MDTTQLLLMIALSVTTLLLIVVGIQLIFVLKELRTTLIKVNGVIAGFEKIGSTFDHGFKEMAGFVIGAKAIYKVIDSFYNKKNDK